MSSACAACNPQYVRRIYELISTHTPGLANISQEQLFSMMVGKRQPSICVPTLFFSLFSFLRQQERPRAGFCSSREKNTNPNHTCLFVTKRTVFPVPSTFIPPHTLQATRIRLMLTDALGCYALLMISELANSQLSCLGKITIITDVGVSRSLIATGKLERASVGVSLDR